jgi:hypothetical protein
MIAQKVRETHSCPVSEVHNRTFVILNEVKDLLLQRFKPIHYCLGYGRNFWDITLSAAA